MSDKKKETTRSNKKTSKEDVEETASASAVVTQKEDGDGKSESSVRKESSKKDDKIRDKTKKSRSKKKQYRLCGGNTIKTILRDVGPNETRISRDSRCIIENMISEIVNRVVERANDVNSIRKNRILMGDTMIDAIKLALPEQLAKHTIANVNKALVLYAKNHSTSHNTKKGKLREPKTTTK